MMRKIIIAALLGATTLVSAELNIYSARHYDADFEIYKKLYKFKSNFAKFQILLI